MDEAVARADTTTIVPPESQEVLEAPEAAEAPEQPPREVIRRRFDDMPAVVRAMILGYDEA